MNIQRLWRDCRWLSSGAHVVNYAGDYPKHALMFRKKIFLREKKGHYTAYLAGLGFHELYINGRKAGDAYMTPAFSAYDKRTYYNMYDVGPYLKEGENVLGVLLGNGWYNQNAEDCWNFYSAPWRDLPKFALFLLRDEKLVLRADENWKYSGECPIVENDLRVGETYDARKEEDFFSLGYDDAAWSAAVPVAPPGGILVPETMPPVKIVQEISPVRIVRTGNVFVVDFGVDLAGCVQIRMRGERGNMLTIRYGERLGPDGLLDNEKISRYVKGETQTDRYIFRGEGIECWHARFVYHGFRYAQIEGASRIESENVKALRMRTAFEKIGNLQCDNELFNKIYTAGLRSFENNYHSIPTDCPHREKNGWTGDAQLSCELAVKHFDMLESYKKWMGDLCDAQRASGQLPGVVPTAGWGYNWGSGPAWDAALFEIPWQCFRHYGDRKIVEEAYPAAKKYHAYMKGRAQSDLVCYGLGDWCCPALPNFQPCDNRLSDSVYYLHMTRILGEMAKICGDEKRAESCLRLAERIEGAIRRAYFHRDSTLCNMTALSMLLFYRVYGNEKERAFLLNKLEECVKNNRYVMAVGVLGAKCVLNALAENGKFETAVKMLQNTEYPSYGYWITHGATTFHEDWESSFSLDHTMFGDVSAWMVKYLAGLTPDAPAFEKFTLAPLLTPSVKSVCAQYRCPFGNIEISYRIENQTFNIALVVPDKTSCRLKMPSGVCRELTAGLYEFSEEIE